MIGDRLDIGVLSPIEPKRYPGKVTDKAGARDAAVWLRTELGVGGKPLGPLVRESERAGQLILVADSPGVGASVLDNDVAVCVISDRQDPGRRRSTAAHELGHLVIGDEYSTDFGGHSSRDEREQTRPDGCPSRIWTDTESRRPSRRAS